MEPNPTDVDSSGEAAPPEAGPRRRVTCRGCSRPATVCICAFLPPSPLDLQTRVVILQHPLEKGFKLATVPLLEKSLKRVSIYSGRKFVPSDVPELANQMNTPDAKPILLYPSPTSECITQLVRCRGQEEKEEEQQQGRLVIAIDGTWRYSREIYRNSEAIVEMCRTAHLPPSLAAGRYGCADGVRKAPAQGYVTTLEAVAIALDILEQKDGLVMNELCRSLDGMAKLQRQHQSMRQPK